MPILPRDRHRGTHEVPDRVAGRNRLLKRTGLRDGADDAREGCAGRASRGSQRMVPRAVLRDHRPVDVGTHWGGMDAVLGRTHASARSPASLFRQEKGFGGGFRTVLPSGGAPCSSGVNLLPELTPVRLRIVGRAQVSEACERGDRGEDTFGSARSVSIGTSTHGRVYSSPLLLLSLLSSLSLSLPLSSSLLSASTAENFSAYSRSLLLIPLLLGQGRTATIFLNNANGSS